MVKTFVGTSSRHEAKAAVEEACASIKNPKLLILFTSHDRLLEESELLMEKYPDTPCIGTSGTSFHNGRDMEQQLVVTAFLEGVEAICGVMEHISSMPLLGIKQVQEKAAKIAPGNENTVCIEFCTGAEEKMISTLQAGLAGKNIGVIGGTVYGYPADAVGAVSVNGKIYEDACAYVFIRNLTGKIKIYRENIYGRSSGSVHIATKVDRKTRELIELDGRPTADVYSEETGIPKSKIVDSVLEYPLGRSVGDEIYIASMYAIGKNGSFVNYKQVNENDTIHILKLLDYEEIMQQTREKISQQMGRVSFILSVDCIYRYLLFSGKNYLSTYLKNMHSLGEHVGIVGGGEQFENQHVNQTMVCAVFE